MILSLIGLGGITLLLATSYPDGMKGMYGLVLIFGFLSGCGIATFSAGIGQTSYWFPRQKQGLSDENSTIRARELRQELFRHLVISRIAFPLSKLKTIDYIYLYQGVSLEIDAVYLFLDKLNSRLKDQVEQIAFAHTLSVPEGKISVVFYDMTTLYFEASDEDDLRKTGFSKDGKHQQPQIFIGLLVGLGGYAIGYDIYEGNTYEGHTLIPFLEKISRKFNLDKPVVVAGAGLLSKENIKALKESGYEYILGARWKSEPERIKKKILQTTFTDGSTVSIARSNDTRLIVNYLSARATKDEYNRRRGLMRLEKQIEDTSWSGDNKSADFRQPVTASARVSPGWHVCDLPYHSFCSSIPASWAGESLTGLFFTSDCELIVSRSP